MKRHIIVQYKENYLFPNKILQLHTEIVGIPKKC